MSDDIFEALNGQIQQAIHSLPPEQRGQAARELGEDFHRITSKIKAYRGQKEFQRREQIFADRFAEFIEKNGYRPSMEIQWQWKQDLGLN